MIDTYIRDFESWAAFCDTAERAPEWGQSRATDRDDFTLTRNLDDALKLAREGWAEGAERVAEITAQLGEMISPRAYRQEIGFSVVGPGTVDMGRYIMGHPECMTAWRETDDEVRANRGFLKLVMSVGASGSVSTDVMMTRGAGICALVDALEREGYRCEIEVYSTVYRYPRKSDPKAIEIRVPLKRASDTLEPESLAMALAHPATLRRLMFAVREQAPSEYRRTVGVMRDGSYGVPTATARDRGDIHIMRIAAVSEEPWWNSIDGTAQWVRRQLLAQGIEVSDPC